MSLHRLARPQLLHWVGEPRPRIVQSETQTGAPPASPYLGAFRGQLLLLHALHCQVVPLACCFCLLLHILLLLPPLLQDVLSPGWGLLLLAACFLLQPVLRLPTAALPCLLLLWPQLPALVNSRRLHCMRHLTERNMPRCQANEQPTDSLMRPCP